MVAQNILFVELKRNCLHFYVETYFHFPVVGDKMPYLREEEREEEEAEETHDSQKQTLEKKDPTTSVENTKDFLLLLLLQSKESQEGEVEGDEKTREKNLWALEGVSHIVESKEEGEEEAGKNEN